MVEVVEAWYLDLKELLLDYFNQFSEEVLRYDGEFNITTSWFTKIKTGCSSQYHFHKNSFYSGVLYFGDYSNDNGGAIKFNNPIEQWWRLSNWWNIILPTAMNMQCILKKIY